MSVRTIKGNENVSCNFFFLPARIFSRRWKTRDAMGKVFLNQKGANCAQVSYALRWNLLRRRAFVRETMGARREPRREIILNQARFQSRHSISIDDICPPLFDKCSPVIKRQVGNIRALDRSCNGHCTNGAVRWIRNVTHYTPSVWLRNASIHVRSIVVFVPRFESLNLRSDQASHGIRSRIQSSCTSWTFRNAKMFKFFTWMQKDTVRLIVCIIWFRNFFV